MPELPIEVTVADVAQMQKDAADFILLDVREPDEYELAKIEGSKLMPMSEIGESWETLKDNQDSHIIVHCHHGGRSLRVTQFLREKGFTQVQNMAGGIDQWSQEVDSSIPRY